MFGNDVIYPDETVQLYWVVLCNLNTPPIYTKARTCKVAYLKVERG